MSALFLRYIFLIAKKFPFPAGFILNAGVAIIVSAMVKLIKLLPSRVIVLLMIHYPPVVSKLMSLDLLFPVAIILSRKLS